MILIDANLLLYAYDSSSDHHAAARRWLEDAFSGAEPVRLAWLAILAFLRIATDSRAVRHPLTLPEAIDAVSSWLERPNVDILQPSDRHWSILSALASKAQAARALVMDAHLAAIAIEHGATLHTTDQDFARFPGLAYVNPLDEAP